MGLGARQRARPGQSPRPGSERGGHALARLGNAHAHFAAALPPPPPGSVPANALPVPRDRRAAVPRGFAGRSRRPGTARLPAGWVNGFRSVHSRHGTRRRNRKGVLRILTPGTEAAGSGDDVLSAQPVPLWGRASPGATGPREEGRGAGPGGAVTRTLLETETTSCGSGQAQARWRQNLSRRQLAESQAQSPAAGPQQGGPPSLWHLCDPGCACGHSAVTPAAQSPCL